MTLLFGNRDLTSKEWAITALVFDERTQKSQRRSRYQEKQSRIICEESLGKQVAGIAQKSLCGI